MDTRIPPVRDAVATTTQPRPTPRPVRVQFSEVLASGARGLVRGAENAMRVLPGGPLMSVAIRGGGSGGLGPASLPMGTRSAGGTMGSASAEGPGGSAGTATGVPGAGGQEGNLEGTLAQSQEMNLYYLRIQEEVNAQNRTFSALSNVLKAEHDTVKTAIGNIR